MKDFIKKLIPPFVRFRWRFLWRRSSAEKVLISKFLPKNPVIVEAGAHIGYDTVGLCRQWKNCTVHAFEPIPAVYKKLTFNTRYLRNVKTYPLALSNASGETEIHVSNGGQNASSSLLAPKEHVHLHPDIHFEEKITIEAVNLDDWAAQNRVDKVDFLWLDLQGYELNVLKAAPKILSTVTAIFTEVHTVETYEGVPLYDEMKIFLQKEGFDLKLEELIYAEGGNALFVRRKL